MPVDECLGFFCFRGGFMSKTFYVLTAMILTVLLFSGCIWSPPSPINLQPESGTVNIPAEVSLSWDIVEPGANWITLKYNLYLSEDDDPGLYTADLENNCYTIIGLKPNTTYYWRVVVKNVTQGTFASSLMYQFQTGNF